MGFQRCFCLDDEDSANCFCPACTKKAGLDIIICKICRGSSMKRRLSYDKFKGQYLKSNHDMDMFEKLILSIIINHEADKADQYIDSDDFYNPEQREIDRKTCDERVSLFASRYGLDKNKLEV